ncbi:MAG: hypothetical protein AAGG57_16345 [Pseudomonadota bacterium]
MGYRIYRLTFALVAVFAWTAAALHAAGPQEGFIQSLQALEIDVTDEQKAEITAQVAQARTTTEYPDWFQRSSKILVDMATLSMSAELPSARMRLTEMHRQLLEMMVGGDNLALELASADDPMVNQFEIGVGMTERDLGWAIMLEAMKANLPDDPRQMTIGNDQAANLMQEINGSFYEKNNGEKHFISRVDAWAFGTINAWADLSPDERLIAVSVVSEKAVPSPDLMQKVIGSQDILFWLAGMDIGLTEGEKRRYPELNTYLSEGYMAGGVDGLLAERVRRTGGGVGAASGLGTVNMMMELNYDLLFDNGLSAGGLMGLE